MQFQEENYWANWANYMQELVQESVDIVQESVDIQRFVRLGLFYMLNTLKSHYAQVKNDFHLVYSVQKNKYLENQNRQVLDFYNILIFLSFYLGGF